jgi:hypothetical protein
MGRSWREKLADDKDLPKVVDLDGRMKERFGSGTMLIPAPREVDAIMRRVKPGKLITVDQIRDKLATRHQATVTCPLTTGIFAWIAAHAAQEAEDAGEASVTPWWRTLKANGELNPKYPGGIDALRKRLEAEGHTVVSKGKRFFVEDYVKKLGR